MSIEKVLYRAHAKATGGRDGNAVSSDGVLDVKLTTPAELGGAGGKGTNPEQLFAAGWSACFEGAMGLAAHKMKVTLPPDVAIEAEVDLCRSDDGYFLQARLNITVPGVPREVAQALVTTAHQTCPYSKSIRGNVEVSINLL